MSTPLRMFKLLYEYIIQRGIFNISEVGYGFMALLDALLGLILVMFFPLLLVLGVIAFSGIRILYQYERGVIFTLGKYSGIRDPGLTWIIPILQNMRKVDMRIKTADVPRQEVMTKDNIPLLVNTVVYFKVEKPADVIIKVEDFEYAVRQYTQTALRDVVGNSELDFVLT